MNKLFLSKEYDFKKHSITFTRKEMVMKIEKINMPPNPYKCNDLRPLRSIKGIEIRVIMTMTTPIPIVANLA